jgi:class 3 adenylate cyclase
MNHDAIPSTGSRPAPGARPAIAADTASTPPKVLIVDDTPLNLKLLGDLLAIKGYAVTTAPSGEEALAKLVADTPDIVLLDVMMPGLSGYDVCRRIRANADTALLPVVMVTSLDPQQERVRGIEAGADDFLSKPINQPELFARVRSLLRVKALQDEVRRQAEALKRWNDELEDRVSQQVEQLQRLSQLKRFFAPAVAEAIVSAGEQSILSLHRREICYVFVDLRGFTAFTDTTEPEEVQAVLHDYHAAMGPLITEHEGTLDRFAGDGILVFFNDPLPVSEPPRRAARMALAMRERFAVLREQWLDNGYDLDLGIGIARGDATLGAFGFEGRFDYSAIGGVVNLAARLCGEANAGQILIDQRMRAALGETFVIEPVGKMALKGFVQAVTAFQLKGERNPVPPRD